MAKQMFFYISGVSRYETNPQLGVKKNDCLLLTGIRWAMFKQGNADTYNNIEGTSVERLAALSDGVFAVALTLLVLDIRAPAADAIHSEADLSHALQALLPRLLVYVMSILTLGIFWIGPQTQLNHLARARRGLSWIHIFFLFAVSVTPFSTQLLTVPDLPSGTHRLLVERPFARPDPIHQLELRRRLETSKSGHGFACSTRHPAKDRVGPSAVRPWRGLVRLQHVCKRSCHRAGSVELRDRAAMRTVDLSIPIAQYSLSRRTSPAEENKHLSAGSASLP
jgi:Endosomal/lysosomal potassium channel TMEM175